MFWVHTYFFIITLQVRARVAERSKWHSFYLLQWQLEATAISQANRSKALFLLTTHSGRRKQVEQPIISRRSAMQPGVYLLNILIVWSYLFELRTFYAKYIFIQVNKSNNIESNNIFFSYKFYWILLQFEEQTRINISIFVMWLLLSKLVESTESVRGGGVKILYFRAHLIYGYSTIYTRNSRPLRFNNWTLGIIY
jgi:hypothetical protein